MADLDLVVIESSYTRGRLLHANVLFPFGIKLAMAQDGVITLQKLKTSGPQNVTVQHVHVASGGQAVVGNVQSRTTGTE